MASLLGFCRKGNRRGRGEGQGQSPLPPPPLSLRHTRKGPGGGIFGVGGEYHIAQAEGSVPTPTEIAGCTQRLPWKVIRNAASITSELASHPSILREELLFNGAKECVFL